MRDRPIAVGGGVVLAASYEAKRFGVQSGMSGWRAKQLCPDLQFVGGHFREYQRLADEVMAVLDDFTPLVQRISIDEAFLDVSGSIHLFGPPATIAARIRERVRAEIGLPISVGAARTKHLAKIASQVAKPDGMVVVDPAFEREFLEPLPVGLMWGIGPVTEARLAEKGIRTIGELAESDGDSLMSWLGKALGGKVRALAANDDQRKVRPNGRAGSVGAQSAFGRREPDPEFVRQVLGHLADRVAARMRAKRRAGRTVTVRIRFTGRGTGTDTGTGRGMRAITRSHTGLAVSATLTLTEIAERLVWAAMAQQPPQTEVSLLAISVSNLIDQAALQLELPLDATAANDRTLNDRTLNDRTLNDRTLDDRTLNDTAAARWAIDQSIDAVREKFGRAAVGYASTTLSRYTSVPEEFRELAEREL